MAPLGFASKFHLLVQQSKCWECTLDFDTSNDQEPPCIESLTEFFKDNPGKPYHFPPHIKGMEYKESLVLALKLASVKAGFNLVIVNGGRSRERLRKENNKKFDLVVYLREEALALMGGRLDEIEICEDDGGSLSGDPFEMNLELTEAIRGMRQDDIQFTQESQAKAAAIIGSQPSGTLEEATSVIRDTVKLVSDKPDLLEHFLEDQKKLREKYREMRVADESLAKGKGQGPAPLRMVETGKSKRKTEKRKRSGGLF